MDHKELLKRRFEFYKEIKSKVESHLGTSSRQLARYKKVFSTEIRSVRPQRASHQNFFQALKTTQILLFGDFHSEPQSIRSLLRVCRKLKPESLVLGLECIQFKHQAILDQFLLGELSESDFLERTEWVENLDFPFDSVKPLFHWASLNQVQIYAVNDSSTNLKVRDLKIAKNIKFFKDKNPTKLFIVQIGDYHLAQKHLPLNLKRLDRRLKVQTVFQSPDEVYFKWMQQKRSMTDFLKLGQNRWAVMAVLPWVKWQNYLLWLENSASIVADTEDAGIDLTDHIARFVRFLSEAMKLPADSSELSIYDISAVDSKKEFKGLDPQLRIKIKNDITDQKSCFVPELEKGVRAKSFFESYL